MREMTKQFEVDGVTYIGSQWSTTKALKMMGEIGKVVGEPIGALIGGGLNSEIDVASIGKSFSSIFLQISPDQLPVLVKKIFEELQIIDENGKQRNVIFDTDFCGKLSHMFKLCFEVLRYQFDFLQEFVGNTPQIPARQVPRVQAL